MSVQDKPHRDPKKPFTPAELKTIQLALGDLILFYAGYVYIERLRRHAPEEIGPVLDRFFETAFVAVLDGLYPSDRNRGLLPVLRLVGCNTLANGIVAALDRKIGSSTFAEIRNVYRDKAIAHPHYTAKAMQPIVDVNQHLQTREDVDAYGEASHTERANTAAAYIWFKRNYPQLVAHAESIE